MIKQLILFSLLLLALNELKASDNIGLVTCKNESLINIVTIERLKSFILLMEKSNKSKLIIIQKDKDAIIYKFTN